jgi:hypothetical protein
MSLHPEVHVVVHVDGVRLCLWTAASNGSNVHPPGYIYMSMNSYGGMILTEKNRRTWRKTCPNDNLSIINPTWTKPGANPRLRDDRPNCTIIFTYTSGKISKLDLWEISENCFSFCELLEPIALCPGTGEYVYPLLMQCISTTVFTLELQFNLIVFLLSVTCIFFLLGIDWLDL